jgi:hypothetical protein
MRHLVNDIPGLQIATDADQVLFQLLVGSTIVCQKQHSDYIFRASIWAKYSGYSIPEIVQIERFFLERAQGRLHVTDIQYDKWVTIITTLGKEHTGYERCCHG